MEKQRYRRVEPDTVQGLCLKCGERPQRKKGMTARGQAYSNLCGRCSHERNPMPPDRAKRRWAKEGRHASDYRATKGPVCERCGFVPEDACQLDVDHKDGNSANHDRQNLQTLCANCHRLKTKRNRDGYYAIDRRKK